MGRRKAATADRAVAVAYLRTSTEDQNLGPVAQRKAIERWAAANGVRVAEVFEEHVSGGAELDDRPGLMAALEALETHNAGVLLVAKRDRLAREVLKSAMIERLAARVGATIVSADGAGNGDSAEAAMLRGILDVFAEYERALIRQRTKAALGVKRARGERVSSSAPYGQAWAEDGKTLLAVPAEQEVICRILALRAEGLSLRQIGARLEDMGILTRRGGRWAAQTLAQILERASA